MERLIHFYNLCIEKLLPKDIWMVMQQHNVWIQELIELNTILHCSFKYYIISEIT